MESDETPRDRLVAWLVLAIWYAVILVCPVTIIWQIVKWLCRD